MILYTSFALNDSGAIAIADPVSLFIQAILLILGLVLSAIFSGSEVAFFSLTHQMESLNHNVGDSRSADSLILKMLGKPRRLLSTILIGNTFANIIASVMAAVITGSIIAYYGFSEIIVFSVEVIVLTFMILILSEITPKIIAINNPVKTSRRYAWFVYSFYVLLAPLSKVIAQSTINLEKYLPRPANKMTSEDIKTMAEVSEQEGSLKGDEREIIENVIEFGNITAREIMTSRVNIEAVSVDASLEEVLKLIKEKGVSRMPLYESDLDNIIGVIHAKDVLPYIGGDLDDASVNWRSIARKALYIPSTKKLDDLLRDFQSEKSHMAIVVDEYGGTEGLITMDDILEEIVGDIADEYDEGEQKPYVRFKNGVYIFDAQIDLDDMEEILDMELTTDEDDYETLGGLMYHLTERLPSVGERVHYRNLDLTVHSVENNRIKKVRVKPEDISIKASKKPE